MVRGLILLLDSLGILLSFMTPAVMQSSTTDLVYSSGGDEATVNDLQNGRGIKTKAVYVCLP